MKKRLAACVMTGLMASSVLSGCGSQTVQTEPAPSTQPAETQSVPLPPAQKRWVRIPKRKKKFPPKYVFLFIGDGMSYPQIQLTNYFVSASENLNRGTAVVKDEEKTILDSKNNLAMMDFTVSGSAQTYDSTSFAPDSASTATSIATGNKTWARKHQCQRGFFQGK